MNPEIRRTLGKTWPDRRVSDRRVLDTRVGLDTTAKWLESVDKRHGERRQYAKNAEPISGFGVLG